MAFGVRWHHVVAGVALALGLYACAPVPVVTSSDSPGNAVDAAALTPEGNDQYFIDRHGTGATVTAPVSNTGENTRTVFYPRQGPNTSEAVSCATWVFESTLQAQEGVALRVTKDDLARVRAITVTKNIVFGATWVFNVHLWDTSAPVPLTQIGGVDLSAALNPYGTWPLPWRMCARAIGSVVELKVWRTAEREPAWGDRQHGGAVLVDSSWVYAGRAGWYIGHLPPGGAVEFADLGTATEPATAAGSSSRAVRTTRPAGRVDGAALRASR